jgi:hypothetical protein
MTLLVKEPVIAGDDVVRNGKWFNPTPEPGSRYVLVSIAARCNRGQGQTCNLSALSFKLVDSSGVAHNPSIFLAGVPGQLEAGEFFGGAQKSGYVVFLLPEGDSALVLKYEALFIGGEAYLSLG